MRDTTDYMCSKSLTPINPPAGNLYIADQEKLGSMDTITIYLTATVHVFLYHEWLNI